MYETPEAAVGALVEALKTRDRDALLSAFGPENEDLIITGNEDRDSDDRTEFLAAYDEMNRIAITDDGTATLYIGRDQWPFALRLARGDAGRAFDIEAGREELLERRIGSNELDVIEGLCAYVGVQSQFRQTDHDGDGVMGFAAHIISTPGARDGLYWPPEEDAPESPIRDLVARASAEGYALDGREQEPEPYLG